MTEKKRAPEQPGQLTPDQVKRVEELEERRKRLDKLKDRAIESRMRLVVELLEAAEKLMPQAIEQAAKGKPALLRILGRNTRMIR